MYEGDDKDLCQIEANDIRQIGKGNCTIMSLLAQLAAKQPKLIKNAIEPKGIIKNKDKKEVRQFLVTLYLNNEGKKPKKVKILATDEFYTDDADGENVFVGKGDKELWPMLIEKAVVSLFGGYTMFEEYGNSLETIMTVLTGEIPKKKELNTIENFEKWLQDNQGKIITAAKDKHAYSVKKIDFEKKFITVVEPESSNESSHQFSSFQKSFSEISVADLSFDSDCPEDLENEIEIKPEAPSLFSKMGKRNQQILLEKDGIKWRANKNLYTVVSVNADKVIFQYKNKQLEVSYEELNKMGLKVVIPPSDLAKLSLDSVYWIDKTGNTYTDLYFDEYNNTYSLSGMESLELTLDEFYERFEILKK